MVGLLILAVGLSACGGGSGGGQSGGSSGGSSQLTIQGSSTVLPISQAAAEAFKQENSDVELTVGGGGTGDGFEAVCGQTAEIADASRPIKDEEAQNCQENGIDYIELPIALDALAVVANPQNGFAQDITLEELKTLWEPSAEGEITNWNQVRSSWPDQTIDLYGPGTQSGTFDYFTEKVVGKTGESRSDYQASEDDNVLVQGVAGDPNALGYFGFSYYENNQDKLKALAVDGVQPNTDTIRSGEYPLSRPLFIYVSTQALEENKAIEPFVDYYLDNLDQFVEQAKYVTLPSSLEKESYKQWEDRTTGTVFTDEGEPKGGDLETALKQSQ